MWIKTPNGNLFNPETGVTICLVNMYNPKCPAALDVNDVTVETFETELAVIAVSLFLCSFYVGDFLYDIIAENVQVQIEENQNVADD